MKFQSVWKPLRFRRAAKTQPSFVVDLEESIETPLTLNNARVCELCFSRTYVLEVRTL